MHQIFLQRTVSGIAVTIALLLSLPAVRGHAFNDEMLKALEELWSTHDLNHDGFVSTGPEADGLIAVIDEVQTQAMAMGGANPDLDYSLSVSVFDGDNDGHITFAEFVESIFRRQNSDAVPSKKKVKKMNAKKKNKNKAIMEEEKIEYTSVDGEKKTMTKEQLVKQMKEQQEMFAQMNGEMEKEESGEMSLSEIAEKKPDLDRFIKVGRFAFETLQGEGQFENFFLKGLNSSPNIGWTEISQDLKDSYALTEAKTWFVKLSLAKTDDSLSDTNLDSQVDDQQDEKSKKTPLVLDDIEAIVAFNSAEKSLILVKSWRGNFEGGQTLYEGNKPSKINSSFLKDLLSPIKPWLTVGNVRYIQASLFTLGTCMLVLSFYMYRVLGDHEDKGPLSETKKEK